MRVSIVVPVLNETERLPGLLDSTWTAEEVVVVDGGSTDGSVDHAVGMGAVLVEQSSRGVTAARNEGLLRASGDVIGAFDADWEMMPGTLERVKPFFEDSSVAAVSVRQELAECSLIERVAKVELVYHVFRERLFKKPDAVDMSVLFWRKDVLMDVGGWNEKLFYGEDSDIRLRTAAYAKEHGMRLVKLDFVGVKTHYPHSLMELAAQQVGYGRTFWRFVREKPVPRALGLLRLFAVFLGPIKVAVAFAKTGNAHAFLIPVYDAFKTGAFIVGLVAGLRGV